MKIYESKDIRNLALAGHGDTGKTSLTAAMLNNAGVTNRLPRGDDGNTITDYDSEEVKRKISLSTGVCYFEFNKKKVNVLDTPGYGNFFPEARGSFRVSDLMAFMVCGVSGVEVQTEKAWKIATELHKPGIFIVNKLDRDRSNFQKCLEGIQKRMAREAVPVALPIGKEGSFSGMVDLIDNKAYTYKDDSGKFETADVPDDMTDAVAEAREQLMEMIAESSEELMDKYLENGELSEDEFKEGMTKAIAARELFPVFPCSATGNINVMQVMEFITSVVAGADSHTNECMVGEEQKELPVDESGSPAMFCFKTVSDPHAGRINLFKVMSGVVTPDLVLYNPRSDTSEKPGAMFLLQGKDHASVDGAHAGDIIGVAKLKDTSISDTLTDKSSGFAFPPVKFPEAAISFAIEPKSKGDEEKISTALKRIAEEDPLLKLGRDGRTHQILISGSGQLHVEVALSKMKERYKVDAILQPPQVPYQETIKKKVDVEAKYKKQTGGKGQYGHCKITMIPLEKGEDFQFEDKVFGGSIPKTYIPAVEKGIQEARMKGYLAGYPVVDFKVTLNDGSYHEVDSSEMAFKIAGSMAFKKGMEQARPTLLEPIMQVEIYSPEEFMGDLMGDLNSRRGRIQGMESTGDSQLIKAQVPMAEMLTYESTLRSITGGRASFHMEFSHYDEVPGNIKEKIIADSKRDAGEEEE